MDATEGGDVTDGADVTDDAIVTDGAGTTDGGDASDEVIGLSTDEAVEVVLEREGDADREAVRSALARVAENGVVTESGIQSAVGHLSQVVSTPETRVELARMAVSDAREAAAGDDDLDLVNARLDAFETRLSAVEDRTASLSQALSEVVDRAGDPRDVYALATRIGEVTDEANELVRGADALSSDAEAFEEWIRNPDRRYREFEDDVDALEASIDAVASVADRLDGDGADASADDRDPLSAWIDATVRRQTLDLVTADLRHELADCRTLAARDADGDLDRWSAVADRIDDLADRLAGTDERLTEAARPEWTAEYGAALTALEDALAEFEPPVDWNAVEATVADHRPAVEGSA